MAQRYERKIIIYELKKRILSGKAVLCFGAGCGMTAASAERGGADLISIYSAAVCRIDGVPSFLAWLPYGNVNDDMRRVSKKILPLIKKTPCIAGLGVHDPRIDISELIDEFITMGYSGISNEPFCSTYGAEMCRLLNDAGIGFSREVELISTAHKKDIFTLAWAAGPEEAKVLAKAGADVIGVLAGLPRENGENKEKYLNRVMHHVSDVNKAAKETNSDVVTLVHGGPINDVSATVRALKETGVDGSASGSGGERIPAEREIEAIVREYREIATYPILNDKTRIKVDR